MKRKIFLCAAFVGLVVTLGVGSSLLEKRARVEAAAVQAPMFEVDPLWPKPLPKPLADWNDHRSVPWMRRTTSGSFTARSSLEKGELHAETDPADGPVAAQRPRRSILEFDQGWESDSSLGRPGRLVTKIGRTRITGLQSTTREMSGSRGGMGAAGNPAGLAPPGKAPMNPPPLLTALTTTTWF